LRDSIAPTMYRTARSTSIANGMLGTSLVSGVSTKPGQNVIACTPVPWRSIRRPLMKLVTHAFEAE